MYKVRVKTIYNTIELIVDDIKDLQEVFEQPYIVEIYIQTTQHYNKEELKHVRKFNSKGNTDLFKA